MAQQLGGSRLVRKVITVDFPGGPVVKSPPDNAGDTGSIPGLGRFQDPCQGVPKPVCPNYWARALESILCNRRSHCRRSPRTAAREWPLLAATRESPHSSEGPAQPSINYLIIFKKKVVTVLWPGMMRQCVVEAVGLSESLRRGREEGGPRNRWRLKGKGYAYLGGCGGRTGTWD